MKLLEPGRIGNLEIKNRIIMAPMGMRGTCDLTTEEYWGERVRAYYGARDFYTEHRPDCTFYRNNTRILRSQCWPRNGDLQAQRSSCCSIFF